MKTPLLVGIDVGTTSIKASLFDADGTALRAIARPYPMARPAPGLAEQDPADWTSRVTATLAALASGLSDGAVAGVGLTSQVNTHVFVGADGQALMPAITAVVLGGTSILGGAARIWGPSPASSSSRCCNRSPPSCRCRKPAARSSTAW